MKRSIVETSEVAVDRIPLRCSSASPEAPEAVARNRAMVHVWSLSEGSQLRINLTCALTPWFLPEVRLGTLRCPTESAPAPGLITGLLPRGGPEQCFSVRNFFPRFRSTSGARWLGGTASTVSSGGAPSRAPARTDGYSGSCFLRGPFPGAMSDTAAVPVAVAAGGFLRCHGK